MHTRRRLAAVLSAAALLAGGLTTRSTAPAHAHGASPECYGEIAVEDVREGALTECIFHFTGTPFLVEGYFDTDNPLIKADIHVVVTMVDRNGDRQPMPVECTDLGSVGRQRAQCRAEWNPTGMSRTSIEVPMLHDEVWFICEAHTHSRESRLYDRYFGANAGGQFRCASAPLDATPGTLSVPEPPPLPPSAPTFAAVPVDRYVTNPTVVVRQVAKYSEPVFLNLDQNLHDVVALDYTRPDGSAPWCFEYEPGTCPLFWSRLIGQGETTQVFGFVGIAPGSYRYYCSIHPDMIATVTVE